MNTNAFPHISHLLAVIFTVFNLAITDRTSLLPATSAMSLNNSMKYVLVTGGNKGIGKAICQRLLSEWDDTYVILGSRNKERGEGAIQDIVSTLGPEKCRDRIELLIVDTSSSASVDQAAEEFTSRHPSPVEFYGIINNAGVGLADYKETINTNYFGPRRINDAFGKLLKRPGGRIVNVSSAAGPSFLQKLKDTDIAKTKLMEPWTLPGGVAEIDELARSLSGSINDPFDAYGASKALLNAYTAVHSKLEPSLIINSCTPGFIKTDMGAGMGATKPPSVGAVPPCWLMMDTVAIPNLPGGRYYGSDCIRSPLHYYRGPGDEPYVDDSDKVELPESAKAVTAKI